MMKEVCTQPLSFHRKIHCKSPQSSNRDRIFRNLQISGETLKLNTSCTECIETKDLLIIVQRCRDKGATHIFFLLSSCLGLQEHIERLYSTIKVVPNVALIEGYNLP